MEITIERITELVKGRNILNRIHLKEIIAGLGVDYKKHERKVRALISESAEIGTAGTDGGYFYIDNIWDLETATADLLSRMKAIARRVARMRDRFTSRNHQPMPFKSYTSADLSDMLRCDKIPEYLLRS